MSRYSEDSERLWKVEEVKAGGNESLIWREVNGAAGKWVIEAETDGKAQQPMQLFQVRGQPALLLESRGRWWQGSSI